VSRAARRGPAGWCQRIEIGSPGPAQDARPVPRRRPDAQDCRSLPTQNAGTDAGFSGGDGHAERRTATRAPPQGSAMMPVTTLRSPTALSGKVVGEQCHQPGRIRLTRKRQPWRREPRLALLTGVAAAGGSPSSSSAVRPASARIASWATTTPASACGLVVPPGRQDQSCAGQDLHSDHQACSKCRFRLAQIRCSWRLPSQVISGPSSPNAPLGRTSPAHRIRVPPPAGSNRSV
jgi:hypothetical protein